MKKTKNQTKPKLSFTCYFCEKSLKWEEIRGVMTIEDKFSKNKVKGCICNDCFYKWFYKFENWFEL